MSTLLQPESHSGEYQIRPTPVTIAPAPSDQVPLPTRQRVAECLGRGAAEEARALVQACLDRYRGGIQDGL